MCKYEIPMFVSIQSNTTKFNTKRAIYCLENRIKQTNSPVRLNFIPKLR